MNRLLLFLPAATLLAQTSVWDGVYTTAQAERGKAAFEMSCVNCHIKDLSGSVRGPALRGEKFLADWLNGSVNTLYDKIRFSMPATYPESVADDVKLDILAYLFQVNGFPAGSGELKQDADRLEKIQIVKKDATGLPNFVLAQVVGCLSQGAGKKWTLTQASEPVAAKDDAAATSDMKLGAQTFILVSVTPFHPESLQGQKVMAKGLLYREPSENRMNLTSLQSVAPGCSN